MRAVGGMKNERIYRSFFMTDFRKRCKWKALAIACLATVVLWGCPAWGQTIGQLTINYIEASNVEGQFVNQVRAYATVSTADQAPVTGLSIIDFEILEDGKPITLDAVEPATDPMAVILVIDTSGSMQARDKSGQTSMDAAKNAAIDFVSMLSEKDRVAIYSFNSEPVLEMDFSVDRERAVEVLNAVSARTKAPTCLYDTAYTAVKKAAEIPMGRRAIVLLTDGKDEKGGGRCSTYSTTDVIDAATTKTIRVPIYTIGVGPKVDVQDLGRISRLTGGRNLIAKSVSELNAFYQLLAQQLKNQYVVKYSTQTPSGEHSLVVKVVREGEGGQDEKRFWLPPLPVLYPPTVAILNPAASGEIKGGNTVRIQVGITPPDTVTKVRYYVDAGLKAEITEAPFDTFKWDTTGVPTGLHVIRVEAIDIRGQSGFAELTKKVQGPPPPKPAPVAPPAPSSAPQSEAQKPSSIIPVAVGVIVLLIIAGAIYWMLQRKKRDSMDTGPGVSSLSEEGTEDIEDETMMMADFGEAENAPTATLTVLESLELDPGTSFELMGRATVGRTDRNDINIPDKPVSRKHGEIYYEDQAYYIRDRGSSNGVKVDGKRVSMDGSPLMDGAEIRLGPKTALQFNCSALNQQADFDDRTRKYGA